MIFRYIETFDWMLCIYRAINGCFSRTKQIKLFFKKTLKWKDISALTITGTIPDVIILSNLSFQGVRKINLCSILPWWIHPPPSRVNLQLGKLSGGNLIRGNSTWGNWQGRNFPSTHRFMYDVLSCNFYTISSSYSQ